MYTKIMMKAIHADDIDKNTNESYSIDKYLPNQ